MTDRPTPAAARPTNPLVLLGVAGALVAGVLAASALIGPSDAPEFFFTYALIQGVVFLALIYLADIYEREPIAAVGFMVFWGSTVACLMALPGNEFVIDRLSDDVATVFGPAIAAPLVEELSKGLALVLALVVSTQIARRLGTQPFEGVTDGIVYGAAVGLGFALTEDIFYFFNTALDAAAQGAGAAQGLSAGFEVFRSRVDFFGFNMLGHAVYTGLFGAGLGAATVVVGRARRIGVAAGGLGLAMAAHFLHNGLLGIMLTSEYGLGGAADIIGHGQAPLGRGPAVEATIADAASTAEIIDLMVLVGFFCAVALWIRHQQRIIAVELAEEDPEVAAPVEVHLTVHYGARLVAYARMLLDGTVEEWRLARLLHSELTQLAFLKHRIGQGLAPVALVDNQRYLTTWANAALRANRDKPDRGAAELLALSDEALRSSRYDLAESLLAVRSELVVPDDGARGRMAVVAGRQLAESAYRPAEAIERYHSALACFDRVLARDPADADTHTQRAGALFRLGESQQSLGREEEAMASFAAAVAAAGSALALDGDLMEAHRNRAAASMRMGETHAADLRPGEAAAAFAAAIESSRATLALAPADARAHNIACLAFGGMGEAQAALGREAEAKGSFEQAVAAGTEATRLVPDFAYAYVNTAAAGAGLGGLGAPHVTAAEAETAHLAAVSACDEALRQNPEYVKALAGRAAARVGLARLLTAVGRAAEAGVAIDGALADGEHALALAPGHLPAHRTRGEAFLLRAELERGAGHALAAATAAGSAVAACDEALRIDPDDPTVLDLRQRAAAATGAVGAPPMA